MFPRDPDPEEGDTRGEGQFFEFLGESASKGSV